MAKTEWDQFPFYVYSIPERMNLPFGGSFGIPNVQREVLLDMLPLELKKVQSNGDFLIKSNNVLYLVTTGGEVLLQEGDSLRQEKQIEDLRAMR